MTKKKNVRYVIKNSDLNGFALALAVIAGLIVGGLFLAGSLALSGWIVMILAGALHAEVSASIPAISFWGAVLVVLALSVVGSFFRSKS